MNNQLFIDLLLIPISTILLLCYLTIGCVIATYMLYIKRKTMGVVLYSFSKQGKKTAAFSTLDELKFVFIFLLMWPFMYIWIGWEIPPPKGREDMPVDEEIKRAA